MTVKEFKEIIRKNTSNPFMDWLRERRLLNENKSVILKNKEE